MRLFPGDDVPDLTALAQEMPSPWLMPRGFSRAHRDRLGKLVVRAVRAFDPRIRGVQLRWAEADYVRDGRLKLPERVLVWWRSDQADEDPREVMHEAPRVVHGLHLLDLDRDPGVAALGWLAPLKMRLVYKLTDVLLENGGDGEAELLIEAINEAADRLVSPIDLLDFAERLVEARTSGMSLSDAKEEAVAAVLTGEIAWRTATAGNVEEWEAAFRGEGKPAKLPPTVHDILLARGLEESDLVARPPLLDWLAVPGMHRRVTERLRRQVTASGEAQSLAERAAASVEEHLRVWSSGWAPSKVGANPMALGVPEPMLVGQEIADLQAAAAEAPAGKARWTLKAYLADALRRADRLGEALPIYAQAAEESEAAEHWSDLGWICWNWGIALLRVGQLDRAREARLKSAEARRRAGKPRVLSVGSELEALRVDVMQGRAEEALPAIEAKLGELRAWWASLQQGQPVSEAPNNEVLAGSLMGGLNIAGQAYLSLERWQPCLDLLGELEQVQRALGISEHEQARTRANRYTPLIRLGKLDEARAVLEGCLDIFRRIVDAADEAGALSALADVWYALGDSAQAIAHERRALALREHLPDPGDRAISHEGLAVYLDGTGTPTEMKAHRLAALAYIVVTGLDFRTYLNNLANHISKSAAHGEIFTLPPLADLLADPAFAALRTFLADRAISTADLQTAIDTLVNLTVAALAAPPTASS